MQLLASLFLAILLGLPAMAGRSLRAITPAIEDNQTSPALPETLAIEPVQINIARGYVFLEWTAPRQTWNSQYLTGYLIYAGANSLALEVCDFTALNYYSAPTAGERYFAVKAIYAKIDPNMRRPRVAVREDGILLDFEEGAVDLIPFNDDEDVQGDRWEVSEDEAFPPSSQSLKLFGNTWKTLPFDRQIISDSTVWQISVMSVDGDTSAELQAFGVGDGSEKLIYDFYGRETVWAEEWMIANQEARRRGRWETFRLRVGYDWKVRYGYLPSIDELYFINDNDTTNPAASIYFDELTDITASLEPEPRPKARWEIDPKVEGPGVAVRFRANVENRDPARVSLLWDFGDGRTGVGFDPIHFFADNNIYTVGLDAVGVEGLVGRTSLQVEVGDVRVAQSASLAFSGDVMMARRYEQNGGIIQRLGPEVIFSRIRHHTTAADIFIVNLECPLTDEGIVHPTKDIAFRGRPANIAGLTYAGVDVANLANNHMSDYGARGLEESMQVLDDAGILHSGAGLNEYEAMKPVFKTVNGIRFGFIGFCNRTGRDFGDRPFLDAGFDKDGYLWLTADNIMQTVPPTDEVCDYLIVSIHGGAEYDLAPLAMGQRDPAWSSEWPIYPPAEIDSATRQLAHMAIDLGADLIIQHHPHVLQGFEVYNGVPIASSLGNFAFDQDFSETWPSALVWANFTREGLQSFEIEPVFVDNYYPTPAVGSLGAAILDRLSGYSTPLNATVYADYNRMRGVVSLHPETLTRTEEAPESPVEFRYFPEDDYYRSAPIRIDPGGYIREVSELLPEALDESVEVRLGREILLVGNMEAEGAAIWLYNSNYEARDSQFVVSGRYSSKLWRNQGQADGVTDMLQRIPTRPTDPLTLAGWIRLNNGRDAALSARYYRYRYDNQPQNIIGADETAEGRHQGTFNWRYVWQDLTVPDGCDFLNIRWQLYGALAGGGNQMWTDDVNLIRWDDWQSLSDPVPVDYPNDYYYMQIQTRRPVEEGAVKYRTVRLGSN